MPQQDVFNAEKRHLEVVIERLKGEGLPVPIAWTILDHFQALDDGAQRNIIESMRGRSSSGGSSFHELLLDAGATEEQCSIVERALYFTARTH